MVRGSENNDVKPAGLAWAYSRAFGVKSLVCCALWGALTRALLLFFTSALYLQEGSSNQGTTGLGPVFVVVLVSNLEVIAALVSNFPTTSSLFFVRALQLFSSPVCSSYTSALSLLISRYLSPVMYHNTRARTPTTGVRVNSRNAPA